MAVTTPSLTDSFRVEFRAGLKELIDAYKAATPYNVTTGFGIHETYDYPPESYHTPCLYVEKSIPEVVTHDASTRERVLTGQVVLVSKLISNAQATREQDRAIDELHEWFTANVRVAGSSSRLEVVRVQPDVEITDANGTHYSGAVLTIEGHKPVGRQ
jgi:hypothetical protein